MGAQIVHGKVIAQSVYEELAAEIPPRSLSNTTRPAATMPGRYGPTRYRVFTIKRAYAFFERIISFLGLPDGYVIRGAYIVDADPPIIYLAFQRPEPLPRSDVPFNVATTAAHLSNLGKYCELVADKLGCNVRVANSPANRRRWQQIMIAMHDVAMWKDEPELTVKNMMQRTITAHFNESQTLDREDADYSEQRDRAIITRASFISTRRAHSDDHYGYFTLDSLTDPLAQRFGRKFTTPELVALIRTLAGRSKLLKVSSRHRMHGHGVRYWEIPIGNLQEELPADI